MMIAGSILVEQSRYVAKSMLLHKGTVLVYGYGDTRGEALRELQININLYKEHNVKS